MFVAIPGELAPSALPLLALTTEASAAKEGFIQGARFIGDAYQPCLATSGNACRGQRPHVGANDVALLVG